MTAASTDARRRVARPLAAALLLAATVLALAACDPREAGSAAVVGSHRVTETSLNHDAALVLAAFDEAGTPPPSNDTLLRALVVRAVDNELVGIAAQREGIVVTQGQIDTLINANGGRAKLTPAFATRDGLWLPPGQVDDLAKYALAQVALGNKLAPGGDAAAVDAAVTGYKVKIAQELGVSISPRYGVWDPKTLLITGNLDDLSVPATGEPAASPTPTPAG